MATAWKGGLSCRRLWLSRSPSFEDTVLAATPLNEVTYATLFTYMYRRFGMAPFGGDDYKDLCGSWVLKTPSPSLLVMVSPSLNGAHFSFMPVYLQPASNSTQARDIDDLDLTPDTVKELKKAYQTLLLDLLRPVCVRDSFFNALGEVDDDSTLMRSNKDGDLVYQAKYHKSAGYGVPSDLIGCAAYPALCALLMGAGKGDIAKGSAKVVAILREPVLKLAADAPLSVKRIMFMAIGETDSQIFNSFGLSSKDQLKLRQESRLLGQAEWQDLSETSQAKNIDRILEETTDEVILYACDLLDRLAYDHTSVKRTINNVLIDKTRRMAWDDLKECGGSKLLEETLMHLKKHEPQNRPKLIRSSLKSAGHEHLVAWFNRTIAQRKGIEAFNMIVHQIQLEAQMYQLRP